MRRLNKRGQDIAFPIVIFLVLNIAFFITMMLFVQRTSSGALIYEEAYAKKIGLMLNRAETGMEFQIDVTELIETALKNEVNPKDIPSLIKIETEKGIVTVRAKPEGGFSYPYFSKIKLNQTTTRLHQDIDPENNLIGGTYYIKIE